MKYDIVPRRGYVLIKQLVVGDTTKGGIILPSAIADSGRSLGEVVADGGEVAFGRLPDDRNPPLLPGTLVAFAGFAGSVVPPLDPLDKATLHTVSHEDINAIYVEVPQ